jgi:anti-sigma regulatory factor (Ser/Thr protein kinase)
MGAYLPRWHVACPVEREADVHEARRAARRACLEAEAGEPLAGRAELVATELATNLVRHAGRGTCLFRPLLAGAAGVEILAVDRGPGMAELPREGRVADDGRPGLGVGLAGVRRLATEFDVITAQGKGTVVLARLAARPPPAAGDVRLGGVCVPAPGFQESGDAWAARPSPGGGADVLVVDGLGHGKWASEAAEAVRTAFADGSPDLDLAGFLGAANAAARPTRGAAVGVVRVLPQGRIAFAGLGNVQGRVLGPQGATSFLARAGTLGLTPALPTIHVDEAPWHAGCALALASDGLRSAWMEADFRPLLHHDPAAVAAALVRDHARGNDDATVVIAAARSVGA